MSRERWEDTHEPEGARGEEYRLRGRESFLHYRLYKELERRFEEAVEPRAVAYDGILWAVQAGVVSSPRNRSLDLLPVTLRRGIHVPDLIQAAVRLPGIHESFYEYSERGGFNLTRNGTPGSRVFEGQYIVMQDMVEHLVPDAELTAIAAAAITTEWWNQNPYDMPPIEALGYMSTTSESTQSVA
jgi:hypothetical protein